MGQPSWPAAKAAASIGVVKTERLCILHTAAGRVASLDVALPAKGQIQRHSGSRKSELNVVFGGAEKSIQTNWLQPLSCMWEPMAMPAPTAPM
jgi:hypothetical protein